MAFWEEVDLPWGDFGPVDFWELRRLAASLRGEIRGGEDGGMGGREERF